MVTRRSSGDHAGRLLGTRSKSAHPASRPGGPSEHDAAKFDGRFTSDVVFTAVNGRRFHGWDDIHGYHRERLAHHADDISTWYEIDSITFPAPTVALVFLRQPVRTPQGQRANIGTWVLTKRDGAWWVRTAQNTGITAE